MGLLLSSVFSKEIDNALLGGGMGDQNKEIGGSDEYIKMREALGSFD